jgi:hypothetical protein
VLFTKGSGRLELADAIIRQPIAIRVIVNRIWKGHMGSALSIRRATFGKNGERPVHPELLDYLAQQFIDRGVFDEGDAPRDHAEPGLSAVERADRV